MASIAEICAVWADRERRDEARELAKEYVAEHPDMAESFQHLAPVEFVAYVEQAREAGDTEAVMRAEVWAYAQPPLNITGTSNIGGR